MKTATSPEPFKATQTTTGHLTPLQLALVLGQITNDAMALTDLLNRCVDNAPDVSAVNSYCLAMEAVAQRIAWVADTACGGLPGQQFMAVGVSDTPTGLFLMPRFQEGGDL